MGDRVPKINVYVPDELAEAIKEAGIPVSAICQRALETAVKRVIAIREAVQSPSGDLHERSGRMARFTERASTAMKLAVQEARAESAPEVGTEHLLAGLLSEGTNLALQVLRSIDIEPDQVRRELDRYKSAAPSAAPQPTSSAASDDSSSDSDAPTGPDSAPDAISVALGDSTVTMSTAPGTGARIGNQAAAALELAVTEAVAFGHNYVGSEHVLLGLIAEPDGVAGRILRGLGADIRLTRRAVSAAIAGYVHLRANQQQQAADTATPTLADSMAKLSTLIEQQLKPVVQRIESLESHLPK
jgi:ATP-dependent Clp protease ATP-binding subunit ClpA